MNAFYATIDTILWGRKTYDWVLSYYKKKGKKRWDVRHEAHQLRVLKEAAKTGGTERRIRVGAVEVILREVSVPRRENTFG
jgi:hypothetical protein